jgi:hypothetical protein
VVEAAETATDPPSHRQPVSGVTGVPRPRNNVRGNQWAAEIKPLRDVHQIRIVKGARVLSGGDRRRRLTTII